MKYDELAFFNQQLAVMLRDGIPLEGALKQLSAGMKDGPLRHEIAQLEDDLARGTPLPTALAGRNLPEFYKRMVEIGVRGNDLPGVLTLLADYYQRANTLWSRLKGLMVYPLLVILVSLGITLILSVAFSNFMTVFRENTLFTLPPIFALAIWVPPVLLAILAVMVVAAISVPGWRGKLRWQLPAFREASLAQLASALALMLKNGTPLPDALALAAAVEIKTPAGRALTQWRQLVTNGQGKPSQWPASLPPFPPMFLWLVNKGGEDLAAGFQKAADLYHGRASYRIELMLYGALPVSVLFLGQMVFWQVAPMMQALVQIMNMIGGVE